MHNKYRGEISARLNGEIYRLCLSLGALAELEAARSALGCRPIKMMRSNEAQFKELGLHKDSDDGQLMKAMADAPILIERPIAFKGTKAIIGRPPEAVNDLLSE